MFFGTGAFGTLPFGGLPSEVATSAYLTWGSRHERARLARKKDDDEVLRLFKELLPTIIDRFGD